MTDLIDIARQHVESLVADLEGEADFMPFMTYLGTARGEPTSGYVGLPMPDDAHDDIADVMMAVLAIYRATEAVFSTVSWQVAMSRDEIKDPKVMPSEHPDRVEAVFMLHVSPDGDSFYNAKVIRADGRVTLEDWDVGPQVERADGRFANAIHNGILMGAALPPEMIKFIDARIEDEPESLIQPFMRAMNRLRKGP